MLIGAKVAQSGERRTADRRCQSRGRFSGAKTPRRLPMIETFLVSSRSVLSSAAVALSLDGCQSASQYSQLGVAKWLVRDDMHRHAVEDHVVCKWARSVKPQWRGKRSSAQLENGQSKAGTSFGRQRGNHFRDLSQLRSTSSCPHAHGSHHLLGSREKAEQLTPLQRLVQRNLNSILLCIVSSDAKPTVFFCACMNQHARRRLCA